MIEENYEAKNYVDFKTFKIRWNKILTDIESICKNKFPNIKRVILDDTRGSLILSRQITFFVDEMQSNAFYIAVDINGEDVNFMFCKYTDFDHYVTTNNLLELMQIMWNNILYR